MSEEKVIEALRELLKIDGADVKEASYFKVLEILSTPRPTVGVTIRRKDTEIDATLKVIDTSEVGAGKDN